LALKNHSLLYFLIQMITLYRAWKKESMQIPFCSLRDILNLDNFIFFCLMRVYVEVH